MGHQRAKAVSEFTWVNLGRCVQVAGVSNVVRTVAEFCRGPSVVGDITTYLAQGYVRKAQRQRRRRRQPSHIGDEDMDHCLVVRCKHQKLR